MTVRRSGRAVRIANECRCLHSSLSCLLAITLFVPLFKETLEELAWVLRWRSGLAKQTAEPFNCLVLVANRHDKILLEKQDLCKLL